MAAAIKAEQWPMEWTDTLPDVIAQARAEYRADVIAYAREHGRAATLAEFPETDEVKAIFASLDAHS